MNRDTASVFKSERAAEIGGRDFADAVTDQDRWFHPERRPMYGNANLQRKNAWLRDRRLVHPRVRFVARKFVENGPIDEFGEFAVTGLDRRPIGLAGLH